MKPTNMAMSTMKLQKKIRIILVNGISMSVCMKLPITNNATFKMPMTGDDGKWKYGFIGLGIVMAISAGFVICNVRTQKARKRKK